MQLKKQPEVNNSDALKQRVTAMHRFYFKGMSSPASNILYHAESYAHAIEKGQHRRQDAGFWAEDMAQCFFTIKGLYACIPFDSLRGNADYYPLFAGRNALKMAESKLEGALAAKEPAEVEVLINDLRGNLRLFRDWGLVYRARINAIFRQIHKIEGNRDFQIELVDIDRISWGNLRGV